MSNAIETIIIVGGGTAGWLAAAYLNRALNRGETRRCQITLIESSDIGTIGVGEATVPSLRRTLHFLGLPESEWMVRCQATFKLANRYVNWSGLPAQSVFYHPFGGVPLVNGVELAYYWLQRKLRGYAEPFDTSCYPVVALCQAYKSPKLLAEADYAGQTPYSYHMDAGLLAGYLKEKAKAGGVRQVVDNVLAVALDERGFISHLKTAQHGHLTADLFLDCSGFRGLLINQTLQEPFISYADCLFCDRAIALLTGHADPRRLNPYATATALSAGWAWHAPLFQRSGNGYVYASAFITPEAAEQELRRHLGERAEGRQAKHLVMRIGRTRNAWVNNCVSIGLASGFVEPLEATGIGLIEVELEDLVRYFPDKNFEPIVIKKYNQLMQQYYEHIRDFLVLLYSSTHREDTPFWRENKYHPALPDSLKAKLELWQVLPPLAEPLRDPPNGFGPLSYLGVLAGMGRLPQRSLPRLDYGDETEAEQAFAQVKAEAARLVATLPDQVDYLRWLRFYDQLREAYQADGVTGG